VSDGTIGLFGIAHLVLFGLVLPLAAWRGGRRIERLPLPGRKQHFSSVIVQQLVFGAFSLWVAHRLGLDLFPSPRLDWPGLVAGVVLLAVALLLLYPRWERAVRERVRSVYLVTPRDRPERALWVGLSFGAGIVEEISYRGVLFWIVTELTGSVAASVVLCSLAFGLGHLVQGWGAAWVVVGFAAGFHALVLLSGSLYAAMAVHVSYDIIAGISYGRLADRLDLPLEAPPPASPASAIDSPARTLS
jgi:membrane protease YdiL (CAAX protease family)